MQNFTEKRRIMEKFDEIISLGYNCEVSFRIEDFFGKINPMPFSWSYILDRSKFPEVLRNCTTILSRGESLCEDHMVKCNLYDIKFHPRYSILPQFGAYTEEQYQSAVNELRDRVAHLTEKFVTLCHSDKQTLFVMKVEDYGNEENVSYVRAVVDALNEVYISQNFMLAVFMQTTGITQELKNLESNRLKIFGLKKFAPKKHTNTMGDVKGWYRAFCELTREKEKKYFRRVNKRRWDWFWGTVARKLHLAKK